MKILFVIPRMGGGGAERVVSLLANELADKGNHITVFTFVGGESFYRLADTVDYKTADARISKKNRWIRMASELVSFPKTFFRLRHEIKGESYAVVVPFLRPADILVGLCRITGIKFDYICSERNDPSRRRAIQAKMLNHIYKKAVYLVCQSNSVSDYYDSISKNKKIVIANPVSEIAIDATRYTKVKRIVAVGRLKKQKNFHLLIHSFLKVHAYFPDYKLDIYGDGSLKDQLEALIAANDAMEYISLLPPERDIFTKIADAELFVLSSDYEGFPNVLLEAMAVGLPVISTDFLTGVARELIAEENGIIVPVKDEDAMAQAIARLLGDEELRRRMGKENRNKAKEYSVETITERWLDIIRSIDEAKNNPHC